jgi:hypothetical protein
MKAWDGGKCGSKGWLKVAWALQLIKRESDSITKNLKTQGKTIIHEFFLQRLMLLK